MPLLNRKKGIVRRALGVSKNLKNRSVQKALETKKDPKKIRKARVEKYHDKSLTRLGDKVQQRFVQLGIWKEGALDLTFSREMRKPKTMAKAMKENGVRKSIRELREEKNFVMKSLLSKIPKSVNKEIRDSIREARPLDKSKISRSDLLKTKTLAYNLTLAKQKDRKAQTKSKD